MTDGFPICSTRADTAPATGPLAWMSAAPRTNPLASLSLDIGRLMDRTLAAEMWDRYDRGESKGFSPSGSNAELAG